MAIQQRIVRVEIARAHGAGAGEQHIILCGTRGAGAGKQYIVGGNRRTAGAVLHCLFPVIHPFAGEKRRVGFTPHGVGKLLSETFTPRQCAAQDTGATRLLGGCRLFVVVLFIVVFVFAFIDPGIIPTGTIAGKGEYGQDAAAQFFRNADPRPAGKQRQAGRPDAQQRDGAAAAVQQRLQGGAEQAANHPARGEVPDIIGVNRRQTAGGQDQG